MKSYLLLLPLLFVLATCKQKVSGPMEQTQIENSPDQLFHKFRRSDTLWLVYPSGTAATRYQPFIQQIQQQTRRANIIAIPDNEITEAQLNRKPVFLMGTPLNNRWISDYLPNLPIQFTQKLTVAGDLQFPSDSLLMILGMVPQPGNPTNPVSMITAWNDDQLITQMEALFKDRYGWLIWNNTNWQLFSGNRKAAQGQLMVHNDQWTCDPELTWDFSIQPDTLFRDSTIILLAYQKELIRWDMEAYTARIHAGFNQMESLYLPKSKKPIIIEVYGDPEYLGMATESTEPGKYSVKEDRVRIIRNAEFPDWDSGAEYLAMLHHRFPAVPGKLTEEGLPLMFTQNWMGVGWKPLAGHLVRAGIRMSIEELFDEAQYLRKSPIIRKCFAAAYLDWFNQKKSFGSVTSWWMNPSLTASANFQFEATITWEECLAELAKMPPPLFPSKLPAPTQWNGFNLAHEGYQIYNGYIGNAAIRSITQTQQAGANSVALIPYTGMENPNTPLPFSLLQHPQMETDESIARLIHHARKIGMHAMVKPQIWLQGAWPGDIEMKTEEDWQLFFKYYEEWITHFAVLAEIHGADAFCVGVEMVKTTQQRPKNWISLVGKIRSIFSGKLTYAANWGQEFEDIKIASTLDFIGLNGYYPLSEKEKPSPKDLTKGWEKIIQKITSVTAKTGLPVVLTEIGYCSMEEAWKSPHDDRTGKPSSAQCQKMCYSAMTSALTDHPSAVQGTLIWKWPAYPKMWDDGLTGFRPIDDEAMGILGAYWRE